MTSKIKVDNINKVSDDSNIIKKCGTTTTIGSGASNPIVVDGSAITLGRCGGTVALASGATQTGFGRSGSVNWQTTPKTSTFTPVNGEGYFINSGSAITANLPAGSSGAIVAFSDYARNFATYNLTISPNGSEKIGGVAQDAKLNVNGQAATFVYVDSTKGWVNVQNAEDTETGQVAFMSATGGTITCSGDFKIHTFTGPGTFCVSAVSDVCAARNKVDYLVVAGGGSGQLSAPNAGGGGAGGYRESAGTSTGSYTVSPRGACVAAITATATAFPITVGAGGASVTNGGVSTFSTITSAGGGFGAGQQPTPSQNGNPGGSGGGGSNGGGSAGTGNQPPVSPPQGTNGGSGTTSGPGFAGGGGGGAISSGGAGSGSGGTGTGGNGATSSINGTPTARAGGGGGENNASPAPGGTGGGGASGVAGTANTGGGGGGNGLGGSGIVILRYKFQ